MRRVYYAKLKSRVGDLSLRLDLFRGIELVEEVVLLEELVELLLVADHQHRAGRGDDEAGDDNLVPVSDNEVLRRCELLVHFFLLWMGIGLIKGGVNRAKPKARVRGLLV